MSEQMSEEQSPPLGSWPRTYFLVLALAVVLIGGLLWLTETYNVDGR